MITHIFILISITLNTTEHNNNAITASDTFLLDRKSENNDNKQEAGHSQKSISSPQSKFSNVNEHEDHYLDDIKIPDSNARKGSDYSFNRYHQVSPVNEYFERNKIQSSEKGYNDDCLGGFPDPFETSENFFDIPHVKNGVFPGYNETLPPEKPLYVLDGYYDNDISTIQVVDDQTNGHERFKDGMNFPVVTKINDNNHICDEFSSNSQFKNDFSKSEAILGIQKKRVEKEERKQDIYEKKFDLDENNFSYEHFLDSQSQTDKDTKNKNPNIYSKRKDEGRAKDNLSNHEIKPSKLTLFMVGDTPPIVDKNWKFEEKEAYWPFCKLQLNLDLLEFKEIDIGGEKKFSLPKEAFSLGFSLFTHSMYGGKETRNYFKKLLNYYIKWNKDFLRKKPLLSHKLEEDLLFERAIEPEEKSRESEIFVRKYQSKRISACFDLVDLISKNNRREMNTLIKSEYEYLVYFFIDFFVYENKSESWRRVGSDAIKKYSYYIKDNEDNFFGQNIYCVIRKGKKDEPKKKEDIKKEILERWGNFEFKKTHMIIKDY